MATKLKTTKKSVSKGTGAKHDMKYAGAYSDQPLQPKTFDPIALGPENFMSLINSDVKKPSWKKNKYPVSLQSYKAMLEKAELPDINTSMALKANDGSKVGDADSDEAALEATFFDMPEDEGPAANGPASLAPGISSKFETIPSTGWIPPDCVCAAGPNHVVVGVNSEFRVYNKAGGLLRRNLFNTFLSTVLPNSAAVKVFDPKMIWDHYNQRYVIIVAATQNSPQKSWCCVAISKTTDPLGSWWLYALDAALNGSTVTTNWMDYPMLGFDAQAIYIGMNQFNGNNFQYAKLRILNKIEIYSGAPAKWYDLWNLKNPDGSGAFTVQPCCHFRATGPGPAYLVNSLFGSGSKLTLWTLNNPLASWSGGAPTLTRVSVNCKSYGLPPSAKQQGTATPIATNDNRLLHAVYQHAGTVKRIWTCHNSKISWQGDAEARCAAQWYEIDVPSAAVIQENAYGKSGSYYFFPVIQTDQNRNAVMAFSRCSPAEFACFRITGRKVGSALNNMEDSILVKAGESAHTSGRFGDYFGIGRDASDVNRIYAVGEYAESSGNWGTYVVSVKY